jgi:hypothetical protein
VRHQLSRLNTSINDSRSSRGAPGGHNVRSLSRTGRRGARAAKAGSKARRTADGQLVVNYSAPRVSGDAGAAAAGARSDSGSGARASTGAAASVGTASARTHGSARSSGRGGGGSADAVLPSVASLLAPAATHSASPRGLRQHSRSDGGGGVTEQHDQQQAYGDELKWRQHDPDGGCGGGAASGAREAAAAEAAALLAAPPPWESPRNAGEALGRAATYAARSVGSGAGGVHAGGAPPGAAAWGEGGSFAMHPIPEASESMFHTESHMSDGERRRGTW